MISGSRKNVEPHEATVFITTDVQLQLFVICTETHVVGVVPFVVVIEVVSFVVTATAVVDFVVTGTVVVVSFVVIGTVVVSFVVTGTVVVDFVVTGTVVVDFVVTVAPFVVVGDHVVVSLVVFPLCAGCGCLPSCWT